MEIQVIQMVLAVLLFKNMQLSFSANNDITCEYRSMTKFLQSLAANYSHIAKLQSIGLTDEERLVKKENKCDICRMGNILKVSKCAQLFPELQIPNMGLYANKGEVSNPIPDIPNVLPYRELWTIIVSDNPYHRPLLRPQVKFVGNVNGMSGPACYILLRLAKHLVEQYANEASMERKLMESIEIHIIPNLNPDGYAKAVPGSCFSGEGRLNSNNVKLNTNFPDLFVYQENLAIQKETEAMMRWIELNKFIVSVSVISGAKVVVYPFDSIPLEDIVPLRGQQHLPPDHDIFEHLSLTYAKRAWHSESDRYCPNLRRSFPNGIINGAEWDPQSGTMMDYNYIHGTFEIMVGVSCCRNENDTVVLNELWWKHRESLLHAIHEVQGGIRGQVLDSETYDAIEGAKLSRGGDDDDLEKNEGLPHLPWFTTEYGEFWRPWRPGVYKLKVEKDGYMMKEVDVVVEQRQPTFLRVELEKVVPTTTTISLMTTTTNPSVQTNRKDYEGFEKTATSNNSVHLQEQDDKDKFPAIFSDNGESHDDEDDNDGTTAQDSHQDEPKFSNSKHYLSLTQLDHSFINLFRSVHLKSSGVILKESYGITAILPFLCLVLQGFHLSAF